MVETTTNAHVSEHLAAILNTLPTRPGVYLMKDAQGKIIYVGKATVLRHRVRSYFHSPRHLTPKTRRLVAQIADIETIVTGSELEALILECNLIKQHRPKYNVVMRDDKHYLYIKVDLPSPWPRVYAVRRMVDDGSRYFGPFPSARSVWQSLDLIKKLFPYRSCDIAIGPEGTPPPLARPCLDYHIKRCLGPCIGACRHEEYMAAIQRAIQFLEGKQDDLIAALEQKMTAAAEALNFEEAARYRDQLFAVQKVIERQRIVSGGFQNQDVIALARDDGEACVQVFFVRGGKLVGREHFLLQGDEESDTSEILAGFVQQYYTQATSIPDAILLPQAIEESAIITAWLRSKRGGEKVTIEVPQDADGQALIQMVAENATEALAAVRAQWLADSQKTGTALVELQEALGLPRLPLRIECYDISNIQGTNPVGSMVVFEKGAPKTQDYRRFQIKTVIGANDFAMMKEVLVRRFRRAMAGEEERGREGETEAGPMAQSQTSWQILPDLVVVDGGKGQLGVALAVFEELGVVNVPVVGLAKEREEIFRPGDPNPLLLPRTSQGLYLLQRLRDEAHRFGVTYHRQRRAKAALHSRLDDIPGIGPKRRAALLKHFGSIEHIRAATIEELLRVPGMSRPAAERLKEYL